MQQTQHFGVAGTGAVTVARRTVGRGKQVITVTGERWLSVQREASSIWHSADGWLRQPMQPVALPTSDGGFTAVVIINEAE
jgi:hypothetical protein